MKCKTCGTCRFISTEPILIWDDECNLVDAGYRTCKRVEHDEGGKYPPNKKALVIDGSGYFAALKVEKDFGCILWEPKDEV